MPRSQRVLWASLICAAFFSLGAVRGADAQLARPGELPAIDAATRSAVVESLTAVIDSVYVIAEGAQLIVAGLRANLAAGAYDGLVDPAEFARRLEEDAQTLHHDGHFAIAALPPLDPEVAAADLEEDPVDEERNRRMLQAGNFRFRKAEVLPGGIGYLRFDGFSRGDDAFATATAAMNFLANSNALIIDLRHNGGGSASMIRHLCGYLFPESVHLINWDVRARGQTEQSRSPDFVPGKRFTDRPVYVLTSRSTFSAAEEFTFDLRNLERATVVGDTTGGGGHTVAEYTFDFPGFRMGIRVPFGRAYNPLNNEGWEGVGVIPHIAVPADQALDAAQTDALNKLIEAEEDEIVRGTYQWALQDITARLNPVTLTPPELEAYVGSYGPRRIMSEDGALWYQRENRPRYRLEPLGADRFRVGDLEYFRLEFERDQDGKVVRLIGRYDTGRSDQNERDG